MKRSKPTIFALVLTIIVSSTAFAGNIAGGRAAGNIPGGRTAGHIATGRTSAINREVTTAVPSTFNIESALSGSFAGLIRMLLDAGALL